MLKRAREEELNTARNAANKRQQVDAFFPRVAPAPESKEQAAPPPQPSVLKVRCTVLAKHRAGVRADNSPTLAGSPFPKLRGRAPQPDVQRLSD